MSTPNHSPLPWRITMSNAILDNDAFYVSHVSSRDKTHENSCQNAELIIIAVNSHAHLIESNRRLIEACEGLMQGVSNAEQEAEAALAFAKIQLGKESK